jgi:phosphonate transport system ATP-binding protein
MLYEALTGRENVGFTARLYGLADPERATDRALRALRIADRADVPVRQLSRGMQQRVAIARALMQNPRLILADEPIASLDPRNSKIVMDALRDVNRDGLTGLVNLHDLTTARNYCDRIVALNAGRVVFDGPPAELTAARIREVYGVTEEEFAEEAALAVGATPHQLAVA